MNLFGRFFSAVRSGFAGALAGWTMATGPISGKGSALGTQDSGLRTRSFAAGAINRLTSDWSTTVTSADVEARNDVTKLRSRCRELQRDDPYVHHYFKLLENNVLGWQGLRLEMKVKDDNGDLDSNANSQIEDAWQRWCKKKNCTIHKNLSWRMVCRLALTSAARDGGVLFKLIKGAANEFGFALQPIEIDHLDIFYNVPNHRDSQTGSVNEIRMGVEFNQWKQPVAYWLWRGHPGDYQSISGYTRDRIPAYGHGGPNESEILHLYMPGRLHESVGVPWITSSMMAIQMLNGYREAELVAARSAACKEGFIEKEKPDEYKGDGTDAQGNQVQEMEPGSLRDLNPGDKFVAHDPTHPNSAFPDFTKGVLRGAASGMDISYNSLASDLEGVNYSSIRAGVLEDRENYKMLQEWLIEDFAELIFDTWLPFAILSGQVTLPMAKLSKFLGRDTWVGRRWPWVDPLKDINAAVIAIENRLDSHTGVVADNGGNFEKLIDEIEEEERLAADKGVILPAVPTLPPLADVEDETAGGAQPPSKIKPGNGPKQAASKKKRRALIESFLARSLADD